MKEQISAWGIIVSSHKGKNKRKIHIDDPSEYTIDCDAKNMSWSDSCKDCGEHRADCECYKKIEL